MTILVTGSAGHLGEALMRTFRAEGRPARGLDIKASPFTDAVGSVADRTFVRDVMAGTSAVIHAATLHKPHIATHPASEFIETNVGGTLTLLEEAVAARVDCFVFTSTTSAFGAALTPAAGEPAAWVTEDISPVAKNIYGVSKTAAEAISEMIARRERLPVIVLRTSRFFPEDDDNPAVRSRYTTANAQANEMLYRRADIADVVGAHVAALDRARAIGFGRYIVSATTPFTPADLPALRDNAGDVMKRLFPEAAALYAARDWALPDEIDRVYVNARARDQLDWQPEYDFDRVLESLEAGADDFRSPLARAVGAKGYHDEVFVHGPYPVAR